MTDAPSTIPKLLFTPVEAAQALGIGRSTLYELLARGEFESVRIGASRRIPASTLLAYVARLTAKPADASDESTT